MDCLTAVVLDSLDRQVVLFERSAAERDTRVESGGLRQRRRQASVKRDHSAQYRLRDRNSPSAQGTTYQPPPRYAQHHAIPPFGRGDCRPCRRFLPRQLRPCAVPDISQRICLFEVEIQLQCTAYLFWNRSTKTAGTGVAVLLGYEMPHAGRIGH